MIIADTNIISTFARVGALDHVRQLVKADRLYVTPATFNELRRAVEAGCDFLVTTLATIQAGTELDLWVTFATSLASPEAQQRVRALQEQSAIILDNESKESRRAGIGRRGDFDRGTRGTDMPRVQRERPRHRHGD